MISVVPGKVLIMLSSIAALVQFAEISCFSSMKINLVFASPLPLGYISRSVAGSYDNEGIAIFCMLLTYTLWIKSVKTGSLFWSTFCALAYFYMVSVMTYCSEIEQIAV